ncbi:type IV pilus biogenesis protein PilM [Kroppenstedtia sanguinis]
MPLLPRFSLGIEMDNSLFKLVEMKKSLRRIRLNQYVVHPLLPVWQEERTAVDRDELIQSLRDALLNRHFRTHRVHLTLSNRHVTTGVWNIPEMRSSRMRRWIEKKVLPEWDLPYDDPHFDYQPIGPIWQEGDRQAVVVAVTSRSYVEQLVNLIGCCGLELVTIDLAAHSLQRWLHFSAEESLPRLVSLHVSEEGVEVNLFHHGVLQGGIYLSLGMDSFVREGVRPGVDPLIPVLSEPDPVAAYGYALLDALRKEGPDWMRRELWKPGRVWTLTGTGIDLNQLLDWMKTRETPPIRLGIGPWEIMEEEMSLQSSPWLETALSVPLGAALSGMYGE